LHGRLKQTNEPVLRRNYRGGRSPAQRLCEFREGSGSCYFGHFAPKGTWSKAYGVSDKVNHTPMSLAMQSRIGNITKTFTTTLVLMLANEGKVKLDDPVSKIR
jgi:CubicO group peptidase (beta-lactamase class C family)